jgi:hypothetical protein
MNARGRRLTDRVKNMIRDQGAESEQLELFRDEHPITWRLILNRLKKDNDVSKEELAKLGVEFQSLPSGNGD